MTKYYKIIRSELFFELFLIIVLWISLRYSFVESVSIPQQDSLHPFPFVGTDCVNANNYKCINVGYKYLTDINA